MIWFAYILGALALLPRFVAAARPDPNDPTDQVMAGILALGAAAIWPLCLAGYIVAHVGSGRGR